jgi:hypothetical protein
VRGNYDTGNQAFSIRLRFLTIRDAISTPEPTVVLLLGIGLLVLIIRKRLAIALLLLAVPTPATQLSRTRNVS